MINKWFNASVADDDFDNKWILRNTNIIHCQSWWRNGNLFGSFGSSVEEQYLNCCQNRKPTYFCFMIYRWLEKEDEKKTILNTLGLISIALLWQRVKQQLCEMHIGFHPAVCFPVSLRRRHCFLQKHLPLQQDSICSLHCTLYPSSACTHIQK